MFKIGFNFNFLGIHVHKWNVLYHGTFKQYPYGGYTKISNGLVEECSICKKKRGRYWIKKRSIPKYTRAEYIDKDR